jgi:hypothetical protein
MDKEEFIDKVILIAEHKYQLDSEVIAGFPEELDFCWKNNFGLDSEVIAGFPEELDFCWKNNFGPIRTVEFIAEKIF